MRIYAKVGTLSGQVVEVDGRKFRGKAAQVGARVEFRERAGGSFDGTRYTGGIITEIRDIDGRPLYFIERM